MTLIETTGSLCPVCKSGVQAEIVREAGQVWMTKDCPVHGAFRVLLSPNADWYERINAAVPQLQPPAAKKSEAQGCPFDCGPCEGHQQQLHLPIVPITSACNLDCPICYTHNKNDDAWHMSTDELQEILTQLREVAPERPIINITGGEPTIHPDFERLLDLCAEEGIRRITISTHGLRLLKDDALVQKLAALDARVILSFDSFEDDVNRTMLGGAFTSSKLAVVDRLEAAGVAMSLLPVLSKGENDHELGAFVDFALNRPHVRSVEFHTMTFTGQGGAQYDRSRRYTTYEVLRDLETGTNGRLRIDDFVPSSAAHSLCYLVTYLLRLANGDWLPFPRFMPSEDLRRLLRGRLYLEPSIETERTLQDVINGLWSGAIDCDRAEEVMAALKQMTSSIFAPSVSWEARLRESEKFTKAIYVHAHMDEENFDTNRIRQCPVGIREPGGVNVPSCAYNVVYRERDRRFMTEPKEELVQLGRGRLRIHDRSTA